MALSWLLGGGPPVQLWRARNFRGVHHLSRFGTYLYWVSLTPNAPCPAAHFFGRLASSRLARYHLGRSVTEDFGGGISCRT